MSTLVQVSTVIEKLREGLFPALCRDSGECLLNPLVTIRPAAAPPLKTLTNIKLEEKYTTTQQQYGSVTSYTTAPLIHQNQTDSSQSEQTTVGHVSTVIFGCKTFRKLSSNPILQHFYNRGPGNCGGNFLL